MCANVECRAIDEPAIARCDVLVTTRAQSFCGFCRLWRVFHDSSAVMQLLSRRPGRLRHLRVQEGQSHFYFCIHAAPRRRPGFFTHNHLFEYRKVLCVLHPSIHPCSSSCVVWVYVGPIKCEKDSLKCGIFVLKRNISYFYTRLLCLVLYFDNANGPARTRCNV